MDGRVALVTGGSRGLGRAMATALADAGAVVAVNYGRSAEDAEQTVEDITGRGGRAVAVQGDVTDEQDVARLVEAATGRLGGPIGILVNNAARGGAEHALEDSDWDGYLGQLAFAVKAPLLLSRAVVPAMKERGHGRIINISSEVVGAPAGGGAYVAAKAASIGFTRALAVELGPFGITVNAVAPGFIPVARHDHIDEQERAAYTEGVALARMGTPPEIGAAVAFLASDGAGFVTGQTIVVNGGRTFGV